VRLGKTNVRYNDEKINISCSLNDNREDAERIDPGKLFHVRGPVTGNER